MEIGFAILLILSVVLIVDIIISASRRKLREPWLNQKYGKSDEW